MSTVPLPVARSDADRCVGGMEGHVSRECTLEAKAKSCYKCGQEGHIVRIVFLFFLETGGTDGVLCIVA